MKKISFHRIKAFAVLITILSLALFMASCSEAKEETSESSDLNIAFEDFITQTENAVPDTDIPDDNSDVQTQEETAAQQPEQDSSAQNKTETKDTATSKDTKKSKTDSKSTSSTPAPAQETKKWVEPVYKEVYHEEEGHYETVQKVKCKCGKVFNSAAEHKAHQDAFIEEMRKTDPDFECNGTHTAKYISEEVWVVDKKAYTETVLVSEGHWE